MILLKAFAGAILLGGLGSLGVAWWGANQPYELTAYFISAEGLVAGNDVLLGGVPVGRVSEVGLAPEGAPGGAGAVVRINIERQYAPLHRGTTATIRPKGLLGTMLVELKPAAAGSPAIPPRGSIPIHDTAAPVDLDQINDIFDPATREKVKVLTREGGKSLSGRGEDASRLLGQLPAISANAADTTAALAERDRQLDALAAEFDRVAAQMAAEAPALRRDLRNGAIVLRTMAAHQEQLQQELVAGNSSLAKLNAGLSGREGDLNRILKEMPALLDDLDRFNQRGTAALAILYPCIGDVIQTLQEMQSAHGYRHPDGSMDANGMMLRTNADILGVTASNGSLKPANVRCSGARP
jgi:phospholipid/cholesterol/gamma-HCH transport system substrate-binding protein